MELPELSQHDAILLCCVSAQLLLTLSLACREVPARCRNCLTRMRKLRGWFFSTQRRNQTQAHEIREAFLFKEICERKVLWARRLASYVLAMVSFGLSTVAYNMWAGNRRWMSDAAVWSMAVAHVLTFTVYAIPSLLRPSVLDVMCFGMHCFQALWLSPIIAPDLESVLVLQFAGFFVLQVPAVAIARRSAAVFLSLLVPHGVVLFRIVSEPNFAAKDATVLNPRTLIFINMFYIGVAWPVYHVATQLLRYMMEGIQRENDSNRHLHAASALLELTCDAVCEIDSDLKLQSHSPKLATMLLRQSGASLEGRRLTDFIASGEADRAREILMARTPSDRAAYAFHTHMVDSYSSKFRTEIFQVKYTMMDGREFQLLGLRDFTDLKSLAGENATDAIPESPRGAADCVVRIDDASVSESYGFLPSTTELSDFSAITLQRTEHGAGIVEKRLRYTRKDAFLQIDVEGDSVEAASAPFCGLVGQSLSQSFASDFQRKFLQRLCDEARTFGAQNAARTLPDQVATFNAMPIHVDGAMIFASGVMKVALTRAGCLHVIMCINEAEVDEVASVGHGQSVNDTSTSSEIMNIHPVHPVSL